MKISYLMMVIIFVPALSDAGDCIIDEPTNIGLLKEQITQYIFGGDYAKEVADMSTKALDYLASLNPLPKNPAIVFDLDETLISNAAFSHSQDYGYDQDETLAWEKSSQAPVLAPVKKIYDLAQERGIKVFLITGRLAFLRTATERNLIKQGITDWHALIFRPASYQIESRIPFKQAARKLIEQRGYTIVANIGDQESDLAGGYSLKTFKLPNPMYYIP